LEKLNKNQYKSKNVMCKQLLIKIVNVHKNNNDFIRNDNSLYKYINFDQNQMNKKEKKEKKEMYYELANNNNDMYENEIKIFCLTTILYLLKISPHFNLYYNNNIHIIPNKTYGTEDTFVNIYTEYCQYKYNSIYHLSNCHEFFFYFCSI
jgi:hypothetical protein